MSFVKRGIVDCLIFKPTVSSADNEALQRNAKIDKTIKTEKKGMARTMKMLLLGAGESGKSTIVKQMRLIYSDGFSEDERQQSRAAIYSGIVSGLKALFDIMRTENIDFETQNNKCQAKFILKTDHAADNDRSAWAMATCNAAKDVWADRGVQRAAARSRNLAFHDNLLYFLDSIDRISSQGWLPNDQDMLHARQRTTGISETFFELRSMNWRMIDVGGQRSERRKWIHCFEDVGCLVFVVALSGYDQCLAEDQNSNQMSEAMMLFDTLANGDWFKLKPIILFLNKIDIFKKKVAISPISEYFSSFRGSSTDWRAGAKYFADLFRGINRICDREIYVHYTNATDTTLLKATMTSIEDMISQKNLRSLNL